MANTDKMITETVLKDATEKILQTIADKIYDLVPYDSTEISEILEISDEEAMELVKIINDNVIANNKIWSSNKTNNEIQNAIIEANKYADELIGQISSISLEYVTILPTSDIKSNVIYILQGTPNTLNVYNSSTSAFVTVGDLDLDLTQYYTKTEINDLLSNKADNNNVAHQEDIVSNLTTTSGTTTLSTAGLQTELDKKANDNEVLKKTDINDTVASSNSVYSSNKVVSLFNDIKLYSRDNGGLIKHDDIGGWYSNTRVEKYGRLCSAYFNVTWNDNANSRVYVCTLSDAVKPTDTIACNCVTNNGIPAYLFIDEYGVVGIAKPADEAKTDGIRVPFTYFSSEI